MESSAEKLINESKANGTKFYNVVGYNMQRTPLVSAYLNDSDGTVDTKYASFTTFFTLNVFLFMFSVI